MECLGKFLVVSIFEGVLIPEVIFVFEVSVTQISNSYTNTNMNIFVKPIIIVVVVVVIDVFFVKKKSSKTILVKKNPSPKNFRPK